MALSAISPVAPANSPVPPVIASTERERTDAYEGPVADSSGDYGLRFR